MAGYQVDHERFVKACEKAFGGLEPAKSNLKTPKAEYVTVSFVYTGLFEVILLNWISISLFYE